MALSGWTGSYALRAKQRVDVARILISILSVCRERDYFFAAAQF
jgi:hypothetical protein